jgi:peptidoglycan hydrolase-like protein with peptidoglycan-binding domain
MTSGYARLGLVLFAVLSAGVAANILTQPISQAKLHRMAAPAAEARRAAAVEAAQPVAPTKTLKDGRPVEAEGPAASETTRAIQRELHARGYEPGTQDGVPGLVTRAAILAFEEAHKLPPTAEPSEAVLKAILLGGAAVALPAQGGGERNGAGVELVVRAVQQHLATLGYLTRKIDGRTGADTTRAIREFELDQGLEPAGRITGPLMARLIKATAGRKAQAAR